ncbi:hypothetical protein LTR53_020691, partial [Teratosphaeriaceae sp. CCFEE 6253]
MQNMLAGFGGGSGGNKSKSHKKKDRTKDSKRKGGSLPSAPAKSRPSAPKMPPKKNVKQKK